MFLKNIWQTLLLPKQAVGIEIEISNENEYVYRLILLKREKNNILIEQKKEHISNISEIKDLIPKDQLVSISITGRGILLKKIERINNNTQIIKQVFPNAKPDNFYIQQYPIGEDHVIVGITRKELVDDLLQQLEEKSIHPVEVTLGPMGMSNLIHLLDTNETSLKLGKHIFSLINHSVTDYTFLENESPSTIQIANENISTDLLPAFSVAFNQFIPQSVTDHSIPKINIAYKEWKAKQQFKVVGISAMLFFFTILLINYFAFDYLNKTNNELQISTFQYRDQLKQIKMLQKEVEQKHTFLSQAGWLEPSRASFYIDQLAASIPRSIKLEALNVYPVKKKKEGLEEILSFNSKDIILNGICNASGELNDWIKELNNMPWVKKVTVESYNQQPGNRSANFRIMISIQ